MSNLRFLVSLISYFSTSNHDPRRKFILDELSGCRDALLLEVVRPAVERVRSKGVYVAGTKRILLAISATSGNRPACNQQS